MRIFVANKTIKNKHIMKKKLLFFLFLTLFALVATAQEVTVSKAKFCFGDDALWNATTFDDSGWQTLPLQNGWDEEVGSRDNSYAWYRIHVRLPRTMLTASDLKSVLKVELGAVDDVDETFLNGVFIGGTGVMPDRKGGFTSAWDKPRVYLADLSKVPVRWDEDNVLAVRVYNGTGQAGIFGGQVRFNVPNKVDNVRFAINQQQAGKCVVSAWNAAPKAFSGRLKLTVQDPETGKTLAAVSKKVTLRANKRATLTLPYDVHRRVKAIATFTDDGGHSASQTLVPKYILTPDAPLTPRFNTAALYGARPGSPIHFRFGVSGVRPIRFTSADLPEGLTLNAENGALSGSLDKAGDYTFTVKAENAKGVSEQQFTLRIGTKIGLTPPMGWNSWNCWGFSITQEKVMASAQALIDKGLADYGYAYINVDDAWEAPQRNADGTIAVNEKFPSMKQLGDWLHDRGLKFGIYSSPGDLTCGNYLGSLDHEKQDAESYNSWGVDYLKYDWCGYGRKHETEKDNQTVASYVRPYLLMEQYLREQPRDIFYSLCQYGMAEVWKWGPAVDANSWRTTYDIIDTWESVYKLGFEQNAELYEYAHPGGWNDPDMLVVGKVGWSATLHDTRLTPDEQYTHIALWTLMASNMLIGCDLAQLDEFTIKLLCNNEVNAVNQDLLGVQGKRELTDGDIQVWRKPLSDGSYAIGLFNLGEEDTKVDFAKYLDKLGIKALKTVRDLWRQQDLSVSELNYFIPTHGVKYLKVSY